MKKTIEAWLKNELIDEDEFCPIICFGNQGCIFFPEKSKNKLKEFDTVIGDYWFDGCCYCFSLFSEYKHLSI